MNDNSTKNITIGWLIALLLVLASAGYFLLNRSEMSGMMDMDGMHDMSDMPMDSDDMNQGGMNNKPGSGSNMPNQMGGQNSGPEIPTDSFITSLINVSGLRVPQTGIDVALSSGKASFENAGKKGEVVIGSIIGKYATQDGYDVLVNMSVNMDVSKVNSAGTYVALFHLSNNTVKYTSAVSIGTNLKVQSADAKADPSVTINKAPMQFDSIKGYDVIVNYLDREPGQPTTVTPTIAKDIQVNVKKHIISR